MIWLTVSVSESQNVSNDTVSNIIPDLEIVRYFRDVAGWFEDRNIILMGGPGKMVEGDGMFVVGKRKCGVGRYHSKEHIKYVLRETAKKLGELLFVTSRPTFFLYLQNILSPIQKCVVIPELKILISMIFLP